MSVDEILDEDMQLTFVVLLNLAVALVSLVTCSFLNSGATIELHLTSTLIAMAITSLPAAGWIMYHWFRRRPPLVAPPQWNLKHDSPGTWALTGVAAATGIAVLIGWTTYEFVEVFAQHITGRSTHLPATVLDVKRETGRSRVCNVHATFLTDWNSRVAVCVESRYGNAVAAGAIRVGDAVEITIDQNAFGSVLTHVVRK